MPQQWFSKCFHCAYMIENIHMFYAIMGICNFRQINCNLPHSHPLKKAYQGGNEKERHWIPSHLGKSLACMSQNTREKKGPELWIKGIMCYQGNGQWWGDCVSAIWGWEKGKSPVVPWSHLESLMKLFNESWEIKKCVEETNIGWGCKSWEGLRRWKGYEPKWWGGRKSGKASWEWKWESCSGLSVFHCLGEKQAARSRGGAGWWDEVVRVYKSSLFVLLMTTDWGVRHTNFFPSVPSTYESCLGNVCI